MHLRGRVHMLTVNATFNVSQNWMQVHLSDMRLSLADKKCRQDAENPLYCDAIL